jgi:hypothetical protein
MIFTYISKLIVILLIKKYYFINYLLFNNSIPPTVLTINKVELNKVCTYKV